MNNWEYGGAYKNYNMDGLIKAGTGLVKVHNIFDPLPSFMKQADCIFCDPPCSKANINSFYTKADRTDYQESYEPFAKRFFECVDEIAPNTVFIEVFASNHALFLEECKKRFEYVKEYNATYYHKEDCKCWIIQASNVSNATYPFEGKDEQDIIEYICEKVPYNCIGDLCMGRGLVGFYANKNGRYFVGTELNKKRLAVLLERIEKGKI